MKKLKIENFSFSEKNIVKFTVDNINNLMYIQVFEKSKLK